MGTLKAGVDFAPSGLVAHLYGAHLSLTQVFRWQEHSFILWNIKSSCLMFLRVKSHLFSA